MLPTITLLPRAASQGLRSLLAVALGVSLSAIPLVSIKSASLVHGTGLVTTIAGSGLSGNSDGPSLAATFMFPFGVAVQSAGTIYVSDMAAQRIRVIRNGTVTTLAGGGEITAKGQWVAGDYRDGTGASARFNKPAGLALLPDNTLLVADSNNHCIRAIRGDQVTTYAGNPHSSGTADGPLKDATFAFPRSLAVDRSGDVYVGDLGSGVRKISRSGIVTTIPLPKDAAKTVVAVAVDGDERQGRLYTSDHDGLIVIDIATGSAKKYADAAQGNRKLGYPDALLAINSDAAFFTDARAHTVRLFQVVRDAKWPPLSQPLSGEHLADAANNGGGFRDGSLETARFDLPRGIAREADGTLIVADSGNRRIRRISNLDLRLPVSVAATAHAPNQDWFLGGSMLFFDTLWAQSIPGDVERRTNLRIEALQYDESSAKDIQEALDSVIGVHPRIVVWLLTTRELSTLGPDELSAKLDRMKAAGGQLLVCVIPFADELGGSNDFVARAFDPGADGSLARARFALLRQRAARLGTLLIDLSEPLARYDRTNAEGAAYATLSPYPTDVGRALISAQIASSIRRERRR